MHIVKARLLTEADVADGVRILMRHGVGYLEAEISEVRTKEKTYREPPHYTKELGSGTETHFRVKTFTGIEAGGSFYPAVAPSESRVKSDPLRYVIAVAEDDDYDEDDVVNAPVLDYIGCATGGLDGVSILVPGETDTAAASAKVRGVLEDAGLVVTAEPEMRLASEQKVMVSDYDDRPIGIFYEFESFMSNGVCLVTYLPTTFESSTVVGGKA